ncbi:DUF2235 domain-containing protein [Roseovarius aestuarii]|nr:DUF2235 domain-containing protein [Roseovarius aestuarii]
MSLQYWAKSLIDTLLPGLRRGQAAAPPRGRGPVTHVLILDGTMSTLTPGAESNAGMAFRLLSELRGVQQSVFYEAGLQWQDWRHLGGVLMGQGINHQIQRAYGHLCSRYHPGDRVVLLGYSRGAYAIRSLAGLIDRVGLLRAEHATQRNVDLAWRHYHRSPNSSAARAYHAAFCHPDVPIAFVGVWDTVKALGLRLPWVWKLGAPAHAFHSHQLGASVQRGCHALALDETRVVMEPVLWRTDGDAADHVVQMWFRGSHGDVGGQLAGFLRARPLANIPLVWMLEEAEQAGLALPRDWRARFVCDPDAPSMGTWRGWGKLFWLRRPRVVGRDPSERVHNSVDRSARADQLSGLSAAPDERHAQGKGYDHNFARSTLSDPGRGQEGP